ncbi:monocarboxylate permease-like protein [Metarhizium acridum CQMa 102]|uniref:Monocarboxylate permease-like protein n=1 Tax=Metarhizium acridum (strain CQMa 102) TaxID=655827 RepID=E9E462_METAQ|nr:monocarboxylate permease-like protein [Metarhizium acridum CQMa 102]EFY89279.1 monocarboxylate permease-like protein [Metarhizium acridum CQMa 102]
MPVANFVKAVDGTKSSTESLGSTTLCPSSCPSDHELDEPKPRSTTGRASQSTDLEGADTATATEDGDDADFPDGGLEAWLVVLGGWCAAFCTFGLLNCSGVFVEYYASGPLMNHDAAAISWITAAQAFLMISASTVVSVPSTLPVAPPKMFLTLWSCISPPQQCGQVFDNYGPRWLLGPGAVVLLLGLVTMSFCTEYHEFFLAQSVAAGLGSSAVFSASTSCVVSWFSRRRSTAYGVTAAGGSVGGVVLPVMMDRLIRRFGFPWMVRALACVFFALLAVACCTVRARLPPRPRPFRLVDCLGALRDVRLAATTVAFFFFMVGMWLPFNFALLQAGAAGVPANLIPYLLPVLNAASIFGRIIPGMAADKLGRFNVMIVIGFLSALSCLAVSIPVRNTAGIVVFLALFGFSSGAFISLSPTLIAQISDMSQIGTRVGTAYAVMSLGALVGSPVGGAIVAADDGSYLGLQLFCGLCLLASTCTFVVVRFLLVGCKLSAV